MKITQTSVKDLKLIEPIVFEDERGYFMESFKKSFFKENHFIQDNESKSFRGTLRGLHFQTPPFEQTKLVRVIFGKVQDVVVDLRKNSETFGKHLSFILSSNNKKQLLIPPGFAHGFLVLSDFAIFSYKVDNKYSFEHDCGIIWNDDFLGIDWKIQDDKLILSEKDMNLPKFNNINSPF
tara:strand:+ start:6141 stop:6677 length:537 start_codon:yes stop_codon:yes gene_type:complete